MAIYVMHINNLHTYIFLFLFSLLTLFLVRTLFTRTHIENKNGEKLQMRRLACNFSAYSGLEEVQM